MASSKPWAILRTVQRRCATNDASGTICQPIKLQNWSGDWKGNHKSRRTARKIAVDSGWIYQNAAGPEPAVGLVSFVETGLFNTVPTSRMLNQHLNRWLKLLTCAFQTRQPHGDLFAICLALAVRKRLVFKELENIQQMIESVLKTTKTERYFGKPRW